MAEALAEALKCDLEEITKPKPRTGFLGYIRSPVRAYLMATANQLPEVAFFCTLGAKGSESTFAQMTTIVGKQPRAVCAITQREALSGSHFERLSAFAKALENSRISKTTGSR
jgi:hypothetical protein